MARSTNEEEELEQQEDRGSQEGSNGLFGELKDVASEAALAVLAPVAKKAATGAAKYAVKKGPELLEDTVMPMLEDAGGPKELVGQLFSGDGPAGGLMEKLGGGDKKKGAGDGTGKGRRMPVQQAVDVAAPLEVVYDQWTQFEDYPKFMHRVERVEQNDDAHVVFYSKAWGITRRWEAEIVEQRPDERIVWKSVDGLQHTGVVTFHDLADRLTRIELNIDVDPSGPVEKMARGMRFVKRAARGDLKRFKAYVEMHEDETGAWRGEIQDGDVVSESDDDRYEDEDYEDQPEAEYEDEDEPEAEYEDEDEDESEPEAEHEDEEEEDEDEEQEDEEERKQPARSGGRSRSKSSRSRSSSRSRGSTNGGDPKSSSKGSSSSSRSRSRGSSSSSSSKKKSNTSSSSSRSRGRSSSSKKSGSSRSKSSARGRSS